MPRLPLERGQLQTRGCYLPEKHDPENEIGAPDDETKLDRLDIIGLGAAVLLLVALLWMLLDLPSGLL